MFFKNNKWFQPGFSLVELLLVVAIIGISGTAIVMVINPTEILRQSRDGRRVVDLQAIDRALRMYLYDDRFAFGTANIIYTSLPDTQSNCASWGLPAPPPGWSYRCVVEADLRRIDGNGWVPVNFTLISFGPGIPSLPVDPINNASHHYVYIAGGSWALTSLLESERHLRGQAARDDGFNPGKLEVGTNLRLVAQSEGLVGWWGFDEGTGTTARDGSGLNNHGTLMNAPTWTTGQVGGALSFDGVNDFVNILDHSSLRIADNVTVKAWINPNSNVNFPHILGKQLWSEYAYGLVIISNRFWATKRRAPDGVISRVNSNVVADIGTWHHVVMTFRRPNLRIYVNGIFRSETLVDSFIITDTQPVRIGTPDVTSTSRWFHGLIDEARIYNRALFSTEISAIFNATR